MNQKHKKIIMLGVVAVALISVSGVFALNGYFGGGSAIPEDTMTRGLVAAYNFDEGSGQTAYNAAATGAVNNGTLGASASADSSDPKWINRSQASNFPGSLTSDSSGALEFDGKNDYVNCGNDPSLDITDAITIEAWVKPNSLTGGSQHFIDKWVAESRAYYFRIIDDDIEFYIGDGATNAESNLVGEVITMDWMHVVGVYEDSSNKLNVYVNGIEYVDTTAINLGISSQDVNIGRYGGGVTNFFNGSIDSVRIYNRALSAEEVRYHYNRGGPVAHWKMDEGSGTTLLNSGSAATSNRASGTIYGTTGTATAGGNDTLTDSGKSWTTNEWAGETIEITSGTGSGQTRTVSSNTATVITVSAVWANNPDATSKYRITSDNEWTMGKLKTGLSFDGVDDYVHIGDTTETSVKTISFWLKADDITSRDIIDLNGSDYIEIDASSNITATGFTGVVYIDAVPASTIDTNWHHITITTSSGQNASDLDIGTRGGITYFDGIIDDVRIYNYVRGADEIRLDYNAGFAVRFSGSLTSGGCSADPASCMDYGLAASYNMDEGSGTTLYDQSDNGNDGTLTNGVKWINRSQASNFSGSLTSDSSGALSFDGQNDYVNCGNDPSLDITDAITIEAWVKPNIGNSTILIKGRTSTGTDYQYNLRVVSAKIQYLWENSGADIIFETTNSVVVSGRWMHIVATHVSGQEPKIYVNGVEVSASMERGSAATLLQTNTRSVIIGAEDIPTAFFNGSIDSVRIYNRALSAEEIRYHYNKGNPVVHWSFDEGSGTTIHDAIGNADAQFPSNEDHQPTWSRP